LNEILLYAELIESHRRKTEAEHKGWSCKAYDAVIALYQLGLAKDAATDNLPTKRAGSGASSKAMAKG
jgi:hypothetical protein